MIDPLEDRRQIVHISMGAWALVLRWLTWPQAAALAAVALLFNWLVLPHVGGRSLYRAADQARGFPIGILLYPFAILLLVLIFRARLDLVAIVWAVLAAGDGFATLIGRRSRGPRLPWNSEKSVAGTLAFAITGAAAGTVLGWWAGLGLPHPMPFALTLAAAVMAALGAAFVESVPVRLDDNISVSAAAALIAWCVSLTDVHASAEQLSAAVSRLPLALMANAIVGAAGYAARTVSVSGLAAGIVIGTLVYAGAGAGAWLLLLVAFAAASVTSRVGYRRKLHLGIAEERGGRRGAGNAIANTGIAALAAILCLTTSYTPQALFALAAALVAGSSDTVASEIGKAFGRRTFLVIGFKPVPPGTSGALSLEGTAAGIAAAAVLGLVAVSAGLASHDQLLVLVVAATAASLIESALGATLEAPRVLNNDALNFINTAAAAGIALLTASRL